MGDCRALARSTFAGLFFYILLTIAVLLAASMVAVPVTMLSFAAMVFIYQNVLLLAVGLELVALFGAGYVAATHTPCRKLTAGLCLAGVLAAIPWALAIAGALLLGYSAGELVGGVGYDDAVGYVLVMAVPVLGAYVQRRFLPGGSPRQLWKKVKTALGMELFAIGGFTFCSALLLFVLYPGDEGARQELDRFAPIVMGAGVGLVCLGGYVRARLLGWKAGLARSHAVYIVVGFLAAYSTFFVYRDYRNRPEPAALVKAAKALNKKLAVPKTENGGPLLLAAARSISKDRPAGLLEAGLWQEEEHPDWAKWLRKNDEALRLALESRERRFVRFSLHTYLDDGGLEWGVSDSRAIEKVARLLRAEAGRLATTESIDRALACLDAAFQAGTALCELNWMSFLGGAKCRQRTYRTVAEMVTSLSLTSGQMGRIESQLQQWSEQSIARKELLSRLLWLDSVMALEALMWEMRDSGMKDYLVTMIIPKQTLEREMADARRNLLADTSLRRIREALQEFQKKYGTGPFGVGRGTQHTFGNLPKMLVCIVVFEPAVVDIMFLDEARLAVLKGYVAAYQYRDKNGKAPRSWEDLVPSYLESTPIDPFSGKSLGMSRTESGVAIYSVGLDRQDNEGRGFFISRRARLEKEQSREYYSEPIEGDDIVLTLEEPQNGIDQVPLPDE